MMSLSSNLIQIFRRKFKFKIMTNLIFLPKMPKMPSESYVQLRRMLTQWKMAEDITKMSKRRSRLGTNVI